MDEGKKVYVLFKKQDEYSYPDSVYETRELADKKLERIRREYVQDELNGTIQVSFTYYDTEDGRFRIDYTDENYPFVDEISAEFEIYERTLITKED